MTGDHYLMGAVFYRNFKESREFQIQPNGWMGYEYNKLQAQINGAPDDNSDDGVIYGFGLSVLIGNPSKSGIRIDAGFTTYKKKTAFSITLGIIKIA